jgi:RHS repeat-associated protein
MQAGSQAAVSYAYDAADRWQSITQGATAVSLTRDAAGRRQTLTLPNGIAVTYGYDAASQLTSLGYQQNSSPLGDLSYTYDSGGRRTTLAGSYARTRLPAALSSASYDAANRLTSWGGTTLSHDNNGNLLGDGSRTYTWNARNQLSGMSGTPAASFHYDALGRRVGKTVGSATTGYLYDGYNPVVELAGSTPSATLLTGLNIDEYFTRTDSTGTRTFLTDALGSTAALASSTGSLETYGYEPFGATDAASTNPYQYTGRENDGTGLYHYRTRYYHPTYQRFITEDPLGNGTSGANLYAYVMNSPLGYRDPLGLYPLRQAIAQDNPCEMTSDNQGTPRADLWPDMLAFQGNVTIPTPWTATILGFGVNVTRDRYGRTYIAPGPSAGRAITGVSASAAPGWLIQTDVPTPEELSSNLTGHSFNFGGGFWGGVNFSWFPGNALSVQPGFVSPQAGGGYSYGWCVG